MKMVPLLNVAENITTAPIPYEGRRQYVATGNVELSDIIGGNYVTYLQKPSRANLAGRKGDVIFAKMRATNKVICLDEHTEKNIYSTGFFNLRAKQTRLLPKYLYWFLSSLQFQRIKDNLCTGATQKALTLSGLREIYIPVPEYISEQRRIITFLDTAERIRRKWTQIIKLADNQLKSIFMEMFGDLDTNTCGWGTYTVAEILKIDPQNGLYRPSSDYGSGVSILRIDSFYDGYLVKSRPLKRLNVDPETIAKYRLQNDDIVINRVNSREFLGKSALVEGLVDETVFESNMMRFRVDKGQINPRFFVDQLQTQFIKRQILRASKDAVNQSSINQTDVRNFEIRVPPVELQEKYAAIVGKKTKTDRSLTEALSASSNLFRGLSQRAFNSEL